MAAPDKNLAAFAREVNQPDDAIHLGHAALLIAAFEYPKLDVAGYLDRISRLADAAQPAMQSAAPELGLADFLFKTQGFCGNAQDYADPRNSFLNEVIERRLGIPITLSVLFLEVAKRMGVQAAGVGLPGHFIVRVQTRNGVVFLDPFHGGVQLSQEDCEARVQNITQGRLPFDSAFLDPVSNRYILTRMLNNLKNFYASANDAARAAQVIERQLVLNPQDFIEMRNLGLLYGSLGKKTRAVQWLESYLSAVPNASDANVVKNYITSLATAVSRWN